MEEEIKNEFERSGFQLDDSEEILKKCITMCINYNLKPSDIISSWEVYYLNRQLDGSIVENVQMDGFLQHLQNERVETVIKEESDLHIYSSKDVDMILNNEVDDTIEETLGTPKARSPNLDPESFSNTPDTNGNIFSSGKSLKHITPFGRRTEKFMVKLSANGMSDMDIDKKEDNQGHSEDDIIRKIKPSTRCSLFVHDSGLEPHSRFMYDKIENRFNALENRIRKHTSAFVASGVYEEPMDPTVASEKSMFTVGMICCDGEGHLNDKATLLQSSVEHSGGQRVRLELQKLGQFSIFPGQVVGVEGHNPSGHCLIASKLVDSIPSHLTADVNFPPAKKQALDDEILPIDQSGDKTELLVEFVLPSKDVKIGEVMIASGPFTTTDNLTFEPLTELLAYAKRKLPQLLVLMGPFIDSEHPDIKNGTVGRSFDELFNIEIVGRLQDYVEHMGPDAQVLLIPSIRDANHDFVFPQPALDISASDVTHQITSLSNPCMFEANAVKVGCSTVDIIRHLSGEEMSRNPTKGSSTDRMVRLANHLLYQRSFYPLYPPNECVPLDFSLAPKSLHISGIPDILILPSDMKHFIKVLSVGEEVVKQCLCVNPGRLAKGEGGGTFAELHYFGSPEKTNASIIGI